MQHLVFKEVPHTNNTQTYITKIHKTHSSSSQALKMIPLQNINAHMPIMYAHIAIQIYITIKHKVQQRAAVVLRK